MDVVALTVLSWIWFFSVVGLRGGGKMGKNPEPSKNEPNQNPGFVKNRTEPEPKCHGSYSVLSLNEIVGTFTHFTVIESSYFT